MLSKDGSCSSSEDDEKVVPVKGKATLRKKRRNKPKDYPKRPLSAYNVFFKETREEILKDKIKTDIPDAKRDHKLDFQTMAKEIAARWKALDPKEKERVEKLAKKDMLRYRDEVKAYEEEMVQKNRAEREEAAAKEIEERAVENERNKKLLAERAEKDADLQRRAAGFSNGGGAVSLETLGALAGARLPAGAGADDPAVQEALFFYQQRELIQRQLLLEELRAAEERELQIRRLQSLGLLQGDPSLGGLQGHQLSGLFGGHGAAGLGMGGLGGYGGLGLLAAGGGLSHEMLLGAGAGGGLQDAYHQLQQHNLLQEHYARLLGGHGSAENQAGAGANGANPST
jgi:HMG (high mobility group) box